MKIAIIGSGNVGAALAKSSVRAGHTVTLTAKEPAHAGAKAKDTGARAVRNAVEAVKEAEVVILAVPYAAVDAVLGELGDALAGKTTPSRRGRRILNISLQMQHGLSRSSATLDTDRRYPRLL
jgi:predicted dinucleotide-binding enzyme